MTIDDILKKSISGTKTKDSIDTSNIDNILKASKSGIEDTNFNYPKPAPVTTIPEEPKPGLINRALAVPGKIIQGAGNLLEKTYGSNIERGLYEQGKDTGAEKVLKSAASLVGGSSPENLPFGIGDVIRGYKDVYKNPQDYSDFTFEDVLKGIVETSKEFEKIPFQAVSNFALKPFKFNLPVLGEVSNRQFKAAQRIQNGEDPIAVTAEEGLGSVFDTMFLLGLANEIAGPRPTVTNKFEIPKEDIANYPSIKNIPDSMKSFKLYNEAVSMKPVSSDVVNKMISEKGLNPGQSFNPKLPTYFKGTFKPNGNFQGEIIQLKPSYFSVLKNTFGTKNDPAYKSLSTTLEDLKTSGHDYDSMIKAGDIPKEKIFKPDGTLQPEVANHVVEDLTLKLNMYKPGLGEQFKNSIDLTKPTAQNLDTQAINILNKTITPNPQVIPQILPPAYILPQETTSIIKKEIPFDAKKGIENKVEQLIPAIKNSPEPDEHLITTAKNLAEQSGDPALVKKVEEAITTGEENIKQAKITQDKLNAIAEQSIQTPEKQLTEPVSEPYRPARVPPAQQVYSPIRFLSGTFEGKTYTTDSYILEFNSNVQPPKKAEIKEAPTEELVKKIIPDQTEAVKVEPIKVQKSEDGKQSFVTLEGDGVSVEMQQKYYDYFNKKYPNAVFMAVEPYKPVVVNSDGNMVGLVMPANLQNASFKLSPTWEKTKTVQPTLKETKTSVQKKTKEPRLSGGELGSLASSKGNKTLRKIIERQVEVQKGETQEPPKDFKISERAKAILEEFGVKVGEKSLSGRLLGVYKPLTEKVRVQALYDITTVTHEAIHAIDDQIKFSERLISETGRGANIRSRLTDIYEEIYPNAKRTHSLNKRIKEGLAVFFENYFYDPASITAKYSDLVDYFIKPEGKYYNSQFTKLLDKMNELVDDYAKLSPEERIGARIRTGKEVVDKQTGFNWKQRIEYELFNRFEPLKRYAKDSGVSGTWDDPLVQAFNILNKNSIITNWVKGDSTPVLMKDGNFKIEKGSVADYLNIVKGDEKAFRAYLVARRVVSENNTLNELKNISKEKRTPKIQNKITRLENIIQNDDFSLQDATAVVEKYADKFKEAEKVYDNINKRLIDFSEENGLLDAETANMYREEKGYASFRRYIDEELQAVGTIGTSSKSKVTSFKERTGSQLDIIDPVYNQIMSINEIIGKGMENRLWERVANLANKNPEISQRFEKITVQPSIDAEGRISFPQEKDPGIVRVFVDGKRQFYKVAPEFAAITKQLRGKEFDAFIQFLRIPSSLFTRLTTSANPIFAAGNLTVDQFSALAQTKTGFKPIIDPAKSFMAYVTGDKGVAAYKAMGGERQTLASFYDLSPEDIAHKLTGGETKIEKVKGFIDSKLGWLELPSNTSELMTRYSEFARAKKMGKSDSEAMYMASEVTTPFQLQGNIGGRFGQEIIKSIPYFNAAIQVFYKFGRAAKDDPKRISSVIAGILAVGLTAAIMTYKSASEKQKRLLAEQPVRNLSTYWYIPSPDGENLIKIKIPQQMGVFSGMAYLWAAEHYEQNKATLDDYVGVISSSIPEQVQFYRPKNMLLSWLPQVIKPSVQVASNTKTFPDIGPIVPPYMVDKAPKEQYNTYTSEVAKTIGNILGISPTLTEFWLRNQFGVVGSGFIGKLPSNPIWIQEKDYVMTGRSYNRFYENRTLVQQQYDEIITNDKQTQKYSQEEKYTVKEEKHIYDVVSTLLTEMRDINKTQDLPEDIKTSAYNVLLGIDSTENIRDIEPQIRELQSQIQKFKSKK